MIQLIPIEQRENIGQHIKTLNPLTAPELEHTWTLDLYQPERDSYADVNAVYFRASALTEKN